MATLLPTPDPIKDPVWLASLPALFSILLIFRLCFRLLGDPAGFFGFAIEEAVLPTFSPATLPKGAIALPPIILAAVPSTDISLP